MTPVSPIQTECTNALFRPVAVRPPKPEPRICVGTGPSLCQVTQRPLPVPIHASTRAPSPRHRDQPSTELRSMTRRPPDCAPPPCTQPSTEVAPHRRAPEALVRTHFGRISRFHLRRTCLSQAPTCQAHGRRAFCERCSRRVRAIAMFEVSSREQPVLTILGHPRALDVTYRAHWQM